MGNFDCAHAFVGTHGNLTLPFTILHFLLIINGNQKLKLTAPGAESELRESTGWLHPCKNNSLRSI